MKSLSFVTVLIAVASAADFSFAAVTPLAAEAAPQMFASYRHNYVTGATLPGVRRMDTSGPKLGALIDDRIVYDNLSNASTPNAGFTRPNTDLPTFGDAVTLTSAGKLREFDFTVFAGGTTGSITGGVLTARFYNAATFTGAASSTPLGVIPITLDYSADPLPAGFFTTDGVDGLDSLNINLPTGVIVTQTFVPTGTATANGFVSLLPVTTGSSPSTFYLQSVALAEGFYNLNPAGTVTNVGYRIVLTPEPTLMATMASGGLMLFRRRRA